MNICFFQHLLARPEDTNGSDTLRQVRAEEFAPLYDQGNVMSSNHFSNVAWEHSNNGRERQKGRLCCHVVILCTWKPFSQKLVPERYVCFYDLANVHNVKATRKM